MELNRATIHTNVDQGRVREPPPRLAPPRKPSSEAPGEAPGVTDVPDAKHAGRLALRRLIGDIDFRNASPRQMAETSMDLYVAGILPWEEYAMLAFQPELHPDYNRTIGALTGKKAEPDQARDFLAIWEERLQFDEKYNADQPRVIEGARRIVTLFRYADTSTDVIV
ncbi:MAG: hypothetical protein H8E94_02640 [Alphaproteobacteria bacterium]|nr:hypothetical protein [Alphaproteobacteria bacterium]